MRDFFIHLVLGPIISIIGILLTGDFVWITATPFSWAGSLLLYKILLHREHNRLAKILFGDIKNFGIILLGSKVSNVLCILENNTRTILGSERVLSGVGKIISTEDGQKIIKLCNIWTYGRKIYSFTYEMHSSIFDFKRIEKKLYKLGFKKETDLYFSNGKIDILITQRTIAVTDKIIYDMLQKERISHNNEIKSDLYD